MKELLDIKSIWQTLKAKWATSFGCVVLAIIAFAFGYFWAIKEVTEDCRFMGSFRDGTQAFSCQARVR